MRIIDKNHDFYDYLQDPTDTIVFDRRGSFILTKKYICEHMVYPGYHNKSKYRFILLQCGAAFWLILATITERTEYGAPSNYDLELLYFLERL